MTIVQDVVAKLGHLSPSERDLVGQALTALGSSTDHTVERVQDKEEQDMRIFYNQLSKAMENRGVLCPKWDGFRRSRTYQMFKKKFPSVELYGSKYFPGANRVTRHKVYRLCALSVVSYVHSLPNAPFTLNVACRSIGRVSETMSRAFPGYAESGLLPMVLDMTKV